MKKKADYLFSLKGSRGTPHDDVKEYFADFDFDKPAQEMKHISFKTVSTHGQKHGRIEDRDYAVGDDVLWLRKRHPRRKTIGSIGFVNSRREIKGTVTGERRYVVSGLPPIRKNLPKLSGLIGV